METSQGYGEALGPASVLPALLVERSDLIEQRAFLAGRYVPLYRRLLAYDTALAESIDKVAYGDIASVATIEEPGDAPGISELARQAEGVLGLPEDIDLQPLVEALGDTNAALAQTEEAALPLAKQEMIGLRQQLLVETDWGAFVQHALAERKLAGSEAASKLNINYCLHVLRSLVSVGQHARDGSLEGVLQYTDQLSKSYALLQDSGLLLDEPMALDKLQERMTEWNMPAEIHEWTRASVEVIEDFMCDYRYKAALRDLPRQELDTLCAMARATGLDGQARTLVPVHVADALWEGFGQLATEFDEADRRLIIERSARRPNAPVVLRPQLLTQTTDIAHPHQWTSTAMRRFPAWYTFGVGFIEYVEHIENVRTETKAPLPDTTAPPAHDGVWCGEAWGEKGNISNVSVSVLKPYFDQVILGMTDDDVLAYRRSAAQRCQETLDHELTHYALWHNIPLWWLRIWNRAVQIEQADVTQYVTECRQELTVGAAKREDLCESVCLFKSRPAELLQYAPRRFEAINHLLDEYGPGLAALCDSVAMVNQENEQRTLRGQAPKYPKLLRRLDSKLADCRRLNVACA